jgi:hypothetical protein
VNKAKTIARNLRCCGERESCNNCSYKSQSKTRCFDLIKIAGADELERLNEETIMLRKINAQLTIENNKLKEKLK